MQPYSATARTYKPDQPRYPWTRILVSALCGLALSAASGALLVEEPFAGDGVYGHALAGHGGGSGFAGNWELGPTGGNNFRHVAESSWDYYPAASRFAEPTGGAAQVTYGYVPNQVHRLLSQPIELGTRTDLYLSFLFRDFAANPDDEATLGLSQGPEGLQLQMGWRYTDRFGAGLTPSGKLLYQAWSAACVEEASARKGNTTWYVVAHLASAPGEAAMLRLKAYNSAEEATHFDPVALSGMGTNVNQWTLILNLGITNLIFDRLTLNLEGANYPTIDEIRLGTNWQEVVGPSDPGISGFTRYHGFRADDPESATGLLNPERGYRHELFFGFGRGETIAYGPGGVPLIRTNVLANPLPAGWGSWGHTLFGVTDGQRGYSDAHVVQAMRDWGQYGTTVFQGYCYLDPWTNQPLPNEMLERLTASFASLRNSGFKVLLRFAYEKDMSRTSGPTPATIIQHAGQLAPVLQANADVLYVLQEGFIGAWGEGHSSAIPPTWDDRNNILGAVLDALPTNRLTTVRINAYKQAYLASNSLPSLTAALAYTTNAAARIGFDDDGFLAGSTDGSTFANAGPGDPDFDYWTKDSPWVPVDGELFWSDQSWPSGTASVNGWVAALRLRMHHYTTFSLAHSSSAYEGRPYSMDAWKTQAVSRVMVESAKMPLSDGYFESTNGSSVTRSAFAYIRDHLGYRVELVSAVLPKSITTSNALDLELRLYNRGFSSPVNSRPVWLVLLDQKNRVCAEWPTGVDARSWQPWTPADTQYGVNLHRVKASVNLPAFTQPGPYRLALWLPDNSETLHHDARFAVRCANRDAPWLVTPDQRYGVNLLGELTVKNARYSDWQTLYFSPEEINDPSVSGISADPDGDGANNWEEFIADTSPRESENKPSLNIVPGPGNTVVLSYHSAAGRRYLVQNRTPDSGGWGDLPGVDIPGVDGVMERTVETTTGPAQWFRLIIEAP